MKHKNKCAVLIETKDKKIYQVCLDKKQQKEVLIYIAYLTGGIEVLEKEITGIEMPWN